MVSTYTANKSLEKPGNGDYVNTWSTPVNADWDIVDASLGGVTSLSVTGVSGTTVLSAAQYRPPVLKISGVLTANVIYQIPSGVGGFWFVQNTTSGAFTVTINSGGGGTSVALPQGYNTPFVSDGTNVAISLTQPSSVAAAGINTQLQYNNNGALGASSGLTWTVGTSTLVATNITGTLTGNVTGTVTGSVTGSSGSCTGNAATATSTTTATNASTVTGTSFAIGYLQVPQNLQSSAYAAAASDVGKHIYTASSVTFNSGTFSVGDDILIINSGSASITVIQGAGVTLQFAASVSTGTRTLAGYGMASVLCVASNVFLVNGAGLS